MSNIQIQMPIIKSQIPIFFKTNIFFGICYLIIGISKVLFIFALTNFADMVKLVDMPDLGSGAARRVGSSPIIRTEKSSNEN